MRSSRSPARGRPARPPGPAAGALAVLAAALVVLAASAALARLHPPGAAEVLAGARPGTAAAVLRDLPVRAAGPHAGYSREAFGEAWTDVDHDGCDTRDDVLARDLRAVRRRAHDACVVVAGVLHDPYGGRTVEFARGPDSTAVQVDHVVALSDAWSTGARGWSPARREQLANDPLELLAVDGRLNQEKGDGDAASWLPPDAAFRCAYVARQVAVKAKYGAWVTPAERTAVARVLARCPDQRLPDGDDGVGPALSAAVRRASRRAG